jgi:hypothetical protein
MDDYPSTAFLRHHQGNFLEESVTFQYYDDTEPALDLDHVFHEDSRDIQPPMTAIPDTSCQ